jgi:hypothetical protein
MMLDPGSESPFGLPRPPRGPTPPRTPQSTVDSVARAFRALVKHVRTTFDITHAALVRREGDCDRLVAMSMWNGGNNCRSLSLILPTGPSLLTEIAHDRRVFHDWSLTVSETSRMERQIIAGKAQGDLVVLPLIHDGRVVGLASFASELPDALATLDECALGAPGQHLTDLLAASDCPQSA